MLQRKKTALGVLLAFLVMAPTAVEAGKYDPKPVPNGQTSVSITCDAIYYDVTGSSDFAVVLVEGEYSGLRVKDVQDTSGTWSNRAKYDSGTLIHGSRSPTSTKSGTFSSDGSLNPAVTGIGDYISVTAFVTDGRTTLMATTSCNVRLAYL